MTPEEVLRVISTEIQSNQLDPVTWTQAFAEADGDDAKAKARYIRLRQAQLQADSSGKAPVSVEPAPPPSRQSSSPRNPLQVKREILAKRLAEQGKTSFYDHLGLTPAADDTSVASAIANLQRQAETGHALSAEQSYAVQTLGSADSRNAYDQKLAEILDRAALTVTASSPGLRQTVSEAPAEPGRSRLPVGILAALMIAGIAVYGATSFYQERTRREIAEANARAAEKAALLEAQAKQREAELAREAAMEAAQRQSEEMERNAQLAERQLHLRQYQAEEQARTKQAQIDLQREQLEERKRQAAWNREQAEKQRQERLEQERARRMTQEAQRDLCITARLNNNAGEVMRWCR